MTKENIVNLFENLNKLGKLPGVKFSYAVAKNLALLKPEVEALNKSMEFTEEYAKYDAERVELAEKFARKDKDGNPLIVDNRYEIVDVKGFNAAWDEIKAKYPEAIKDREKLEVEYKQLLKTEQPISLFKVKLSDVPESITTEQMYGIMEMIED